MINTEIVLWPPPHVRILGGAPLRFWHGATRGLNPALPGRANCQEVRAALALGIPGSVHALYSLMTMSKNARYIALS